MFIPTLRAAVPCFHIALVLTGFSLAGQAPAAVSVSNLFGDHMVLQRDKPLVFWGQAAEGEEVSVLLAGHSGQTTAADGHWQITLPALPAGGPHTLSIKGENQLVFEDVLVGEVWIASGQSNMAWVVNNSLNADLVKLAAARNPGIRFLPVKNPGSQEPQSDVKGEWTLATPETVGGLSAVGYAFAEMLNNALQVPIGIIENAWGGSSAEAWVPRPVLAADPVLSGIHANWLKTEATYDFAAEMAAYETALAEWEAAKAAAQPGTTLPPWPRKPQDQMTGQHRPGNLWNSRVLPVVPYPVRGAIWYQGESNAGRAAQYETLFSTLIREWRQAWDSEFPFYWVQLADFMAESAFAPEETWPALREAQTMTLRNVPATGQAVIVDLGEERDIHPRQKEEVGRRLARWALNRDYGFSDLACRSPEFASFRQEGDTVWVKFDHTGGGLHAFDTPEVKGFAVQMGDGQWHLVPGKVASTDPGTVELTLPGAAPVTALRYAWANNPVCNLFSKEGLPATPFRSDVP